MGTIDFHEIPSIMKRILFKPAIFLLVAEICLITGLVGRNLKKPWNTNLLSISYLHEASKFYPGGTTLSLASATHPRFALWNAIAALREEDFSKAHFLLQPFIEDGDLYALGVEAWAYKAQGNYEEAIVLQTRLNNPKELLRICQLAKESGSIDEALAACRVAWELNSQIGTLPLASLLIQQEDLVGAEKILLQALDQFRSDSYRPYWLFRLANVLEKQERWAEAIEIHQQGNSEQLLIGDKVKSQSQYYADLAWAYYMNGQTEDAVRSIEKAIAQPEKDFDLYYVWFRAGQIYESAGLLSQALTAYQFCFELRPDSTLARVAIERLSELIHE